MSLPYFPMYPADFEADTSHLTLEEDGAYNRLLRLMWMAPGCSLPADAAWIARRLRVDAATYDRVIAPLIGEFFRVEKGRVFSPRLMREWETANDVHAKRSAAGKKGGRPSKSLSKNETMQSRAKAGPKQPEPEPEPQLETTDVVSPTRKRADADPPGFSVFWSIYPLKVAKGAARKAWVKATRTADPPAIIAAARRVENRGQYTPHPASWLNAERWNDEEPRNEPASQPSPRPRPGGSGLFDAAARLGERFRSARGDFGGEEGDDPGGPGTHRASGGAAFVALLATG